MLGTILVVILILVLIGAFPRWGYGSGWGYGPSGIIGDFNRGVNPGADRSRLIRLLHQRFLHFGDELFQRKWLC